MCMYRGSGQCTYDGIGNEDMKEAVAVEIELKKRWHGAAWGNDELCVPVGAGHVHAISQQVKRMHYYVLRVP